MVFSPVYDISYVLSAYSLHIYIPKIIQKLFQHISVKQIYIKTLFHPLLTHIAWSHQGLWAAPHSLPLSYPSWSHSHCNPLTEHKTRCQFTNYCNKWTTPNEQMKIVLLSYHIRIHFYTKGNPDDIYDSPFLALLNKQKIQWATNWLFITYLPEN